jgi:hypothetical protein
LLYPLCNPFLSPFKEFAVNKTSFIRLLPKAEWRRVKYTYHFGFMDNFGYLAEVDFLALARNGEMAV